MNAKKNKQKLTGFFKNLQLLHFFEFVEQFMMDIFMLKLTQFEKTGSIGKTFISLGNLIINVHIRN